MPILVRNVRLDLDQPTEVLLSVVAKRLRVPEGTVRTFSTIRRSLDARKKDDIHFIYQIELELDEPHPDQRKRLKRLGRGDAVWLEPPPATDPQPGRVPIQERPLVVGFGPAGMFAALRLAQAGYQPIVLERGRDVSRRHRDVLHRFYKHHDFDPESNILFGEGGAGAYSDGKLHTRIKDPLCQVVLETLYHHGASPDVLIDAHPHIGCERLPGICKQIRQRIERLGGEVRFECRIDDIRVSDSRLQAVKLAGASCPQDDTWQPAGPVVLAIGHSARDTIRKLHARGVRMEPKPFQIGVRVEHPQEMVDRWQYGALADHPRLGAAEYRLVARGANAPHGDVFSFCMCPGGFILPTNESAGLIATNGASRSRRAGPFANAGLVATVDPTTLDPIAPGDPTLQGLAFLEHWERLAFETTDGSYRVPVQRASDFLEDRASNGTLETSYPLGGQWSRIAAIIPESTLKALHKALPILDKRCPGFAGSDALVTGPETRASSPVRIMRDRETRTAIGLPNLYPVGEGAGYAGGIVSAAVDGIKAADRIIERYALPE